MSKPSYIKRLSRAILSIVLSLCLIQLDFVSSGVKFSLNAYAEDKAVHTKAKENHQENKDSQDQLESDIKNGNAERYSQCEDTTQSQQQRRNEERLETNMSLEENFSEIDKISEKLELLGADISLLKVATTGVNSAEGALSELDIELNAIKTELNAMTPIVQVAKNKYYNFSCSNNRHSAQTCTTEQDAQRDLLRKEWYALRQQQNELTVKIIEKNREIEIKDGESDDALTAALENSDSLETTYNKMLELVRDQSPRVERELAQATKDFEDEKYKAVNNSEYKLFDAAVSDLVPPKSRDFPNNEQYKAAKKKYYQKISNLEIMSMASSAINLLNCQDISDVKSKAYPLFKAASAKYIASQINDTTDFSRAANCIAQCISIDEIRQDQITGKSDPALMKYKSFANKSLDGIVSNCKTKESKDGMFINDDNADDDKNEQVKAIERAVNLHDQLVTANELKVANRENALLMFQSAYAAALDELTTKQTRSATAEAELAGARAWKKRAQRKLWKYLAIGGGIGGLSGAVIAAIIWYRKQVRKANQAISKWKNELARARVHGHMKCNYPGASSSETPMTRPKRIPLIYSEHIINQHVTAEVKFESISRKDEVYAWNDFLKEFEISKKSKNFLESITNFIFQETIANDSMSAQLGMSKQTGAFRKYMTMRLGAWQLQTFNSSLLVNLRESIVSIDELLPKEATQFTLRDFTQGNISKHNGKPIQKTGFPLPETRIVLLQSVVQMITDNLNMIGCGAGTNIKAMTKEQIMDSCADSSLAQSLYSREKYAQLLNSMKQRMDLESEGHESDMSDIIAHTGTCLAQDEDDAHTADVECQCLEDNSCSTFLAPQFGNQETGILRNTAIATTEGANAAASGNTEKSNIASSNLEKDSGALQKMIYKSQRKLDRNKARARAKARASQKSSNSFGSKKSSSKKSSYNKLASETDLDSSVSIKDMNAMNTANNKRSKRRALNEESTNSTNSSASVQSDKGAINNSLVIISPKKVSPKSKVVKRTQKELDLGLGSLNFDDEDEEGSLTDLDFGLTKSKNGTNVKGLGSTSEKEMELKRAQAQEQGQGQGQGQGMNNDSDNHLTQAESRDAYNLKRNVHYRSRKKEITTGAQVSLNSRGSIFKLISKRYKKSAYPDLIEQ